MSCSNHGLSYHLPSLLYKVFLLILPNVSQQRYALAQALFPAKRDILPANQLLHQRCWVFLAKGRPKEAQHLLEKVQAMVAAVVQPHCLLPACLESFALARPKTTKLVASQATFPYIPSISFPRDAGRVWLLVCLLGKEAGSTPQAGVTPLQPHPGFCLEMLPGVTEGLTWYLSGSAPPA